MASHFDERVWEIIRAIPPGEVMTYREVGRALGTGAYRAVGGACSRSPGMPDVPCHRVVSSARLLHGFNGGLEKKRELLESEGVKLRRREVRGRVDYEVVSR
jgi:methylated-DNA-[protein]-cysteine S-methyltransferase